LQPSNTSPLHRVSRTLNFALFLASLLWIFAAQAIAIIASRGLVSWFHMPDERVLISSCVFLFILALGFTVFQAISGQPRRLGDILGLPARPTAGEEWAVGAALGWGTMVLAILPIALFSSLHIHFILTPHAFGMFFVNLATLIVAALAEEVAFRGFPFRRLTDATGPVTATLVTAIVFGLAHYFNPNSTWIGTFNTMLAGILFCVAWFRTHGLWLPWGMHVAWNAALGVLFGLPVSGLSDFASVVQTQAVGYRWITGGDYGPEASLFAFFALIACIIVLIFVTRDYAWEYTHPPIIAGGYPLDVAPPAAHTAMENASQQGTADSLVQILPTTPGSMSAQIPNPTSVQTEEVDPPSPS
jgi:membrane protease YdiL (CAAX protease family)